MLNDLDSFTRQYIATALWSSSDDDGNPLDRDYNLEDIDTDSLARMATDCKAFQVKAGDLITSDNLLRMPDHDTEGTY